MLTKLSYFYLISSCYLMIKLEKKFIIYLALCGLLVTFNLFIALLLHKNVVIADLVFLHPIELFSNSLKKDSIAITI